MLPEPRTGRLFCMCSIMEEVIYTHRLYQNVDREGQPAPIAHSTVGRSYRRKREIGQSGKRERERVAHATHRFAGRKERSSFCGSVSAWAEDRISRELSLARCPNVWTQPACGTRGYRGFWRTRLGDRTRSANQRYHNVLTNFLLLAMLWLNLSLYLNGSDHCVAAAPFH